jgi:hypothetical protein
VKVQIGIDGRTTPPRRNGEFVFDAPWESRIFAVTVSLVETQFERDWEPFRERLKAAIAADPARAHRDSWTAALEDLVVASDLGRGRGAPLSSGG